MKLSYSIDINSTSETLFGWLGRPEKAMHWMTSVSKTEMLHETPNMIGTTFREIVEEDGQGIEMEGVVTGYEPNKFISFHLNSQSQCGGCGILYRRNPDWHASDTKSKYPLEIPHECYQHYDGRKAKTEFTRPVARRI